MAFEVVLVGYVELCYDMLMRTCVYFVWIAKIIMSMPGSICLWLVVMYVYMNE